jgi:hypothetical protein
MDSKSNLDSPPDSLFNADLAAGEFFGRILQTSGGKVEQGQRHIVTVSRRLKESPGSEGKAGSLLLSKPLD